MLIKNNVIVHFKGLHWLQQVIDVITINNITITWCQDSSGVDISVELSSTLNQKSCVWNNGKKISDY